MSTDAEAFNLEPSRTDGLPDAAIIEELRHLRRVAKDEAESYSEAVKAQAEKFKLKKGALKRYINALETDSTEDVENEVNDLERLLEL